MFCREQAARYDEHLPRFGELGVRVVAIGNGTAAMAKHFAEQFGVRFDLYTDPSRRTYEAAGMAHGARLRWSLVGSVLRTAAHGYIQGRTQGDAMQQGGVLGVGAGGEVLYSHIDDNAGDSAPIAEVIAAFENAERAS